MVKNYLVGAVRPVIKLWYPGDRGTGVDNPRSQTAFDEYAAMYRISRTSARQNLLGEWQEICYHSPCLDARMFQISLWYFLRELAYAEPCNILYTGADVIFARPVSIFGEFQDMRLFNYTDPPTHPDLSVYTADGVYYNDDVRYFPAAMSPEIWHIGERHMIDWFHHSQTHWDCGQLIHNHMFWQQNINKQDQHRPGLNYQLKSNDLSRDSLAHAEQWNGLDLDQAQIIHFCGSKGSGITAAMMADLANSLDIDTGS